MMTAESTFVDAEFGRFHVESVGLGEPWLFIHGGTASAREWRWVLPGLGHPRRTRRCYRKGGAVSHRTLHKQLRACIAHQLR
jgi:pimeloyl-ACP methyl ester carboxylesterase